MSKQVKISSYLQKKQTLVGKLEMIYVMDHTIQ